MMPPTRRTTVIEIYYPEGFAQDYEWTARALGFQHHGVWNDTCVGFSPPPFQSFLAALLAPPHVSLSANCVM
jgi:hypothetical protein